MGNILLAGKDSVLLSGLTAEALAAGNRVAVTSAPEAAPFSEEPGETRNLRYIAWNPRSPLSARTVITETRTAFETIDEVIIVFSADTGRKEFHELSFADIEKTVDEDVKGFSFLTREVFGALQRQKKGILSFAHYDGGAEVLSPLQAAASGAFRSFGSALFAQYQNEPFTMYGYYSSLGDSGTFAQFLMNLSGRTEKTARRWVKFSGRSGLFAFGRK
jgi:hypothetical protein